MVVAVVGIALPQQHLNRSGGTEAAADFAKDGEIASFSSDAMDAGCPNDARY